MTRKLTVVLACIGFLGITLYADAADYHLIKKVNVGGNGGWDYLTYDESGHRVFLSRGNEVIVVDADSGATVGTIRDTPFVHGIALAPELGRGFTSNGQTNNVTIFDLKTLKSIGQVSTGRGPDAVVYDPKSKRVFTMNGRDNTATVINAENGQAVGTIALPGRPEFAVADGRGTIFVNIANKHSVTAIDSIQLMVRANWNMPGCEGPSGLSMDRQNRRLFAGCDNKVMAIVDADSGNLVTTVPIGAGVDATAFDPRTSLAFSSNGEDGTLTVVHEDSPDKFEVVENVSTEAGARTMALDPESSTVYLVTATVSPKLILLFILELGRPIVQPVVGWLGGICLLMALIFLIRAWSQSWPTMLRWYFGIFVVSALGLLLCFSNYDALLMLLSPADFHMSMWR